MSNRPGIFVCFIGIDGSGKTTQAEALARAMKEDGFKSRYVWNRFEPNLTRPLVAIARQLFLRHKDIYKDYEDYFATKQKLFGNRLLSVTYQSLLWLDYFYQISLRIRLPLMRGEAVICDRYLYDTVADLAVESNYSAEQVKKAMHRYLNLFPRPDLIFFIDLPEEIAYQRKSDVPSIDYLSRRRQAYLYMSKEQEMTLLDGTRNPGELEDTVQSRVKELIKTR